MAFPLVIVGPLLRLGLLAFLLNLQAPIPPARPLDVKVSSASYEVAGSTSRRLLVVDGKPFVPMGVTYHFIYHRSSWDDDLQQMRDLGLNTVRIDVAWRDVEPVLPGHYRFSVLDGFLDRAAKYGLYVVVVFSHTTQDFNTPLWYWPWYFEWSSVDQNGDRPLDDLPCINYPGYRQLLGDYIGATVNHIKNHPAVLAYQVLNEPRYDTNRLYDYNPYSVAAFRGWLQKKYGSVARLNKSWSTSYSSFGSVQPSHGADGDQPLKGAQLKRWSDWRQFGYDDLTDFIGGLVRTIKQADARHPVIVAEMAWWWWGEQPYTGVSPLQIYRDADIVGYDLYPDSTRDASYFFLTSDMLYRYWQKPVWVMELNSKDGSPSGEEAQKFVSQALDGGASGIFYFEWNDNWQDGGNYGVLDSQGVRRPQYGALASMLRWFRSKEESLAMAAPPKPDLYLVWPSSEIAQLSGTESPAWAIYLTARRIAEGGLRIGLVAEELIHAVDPAKLLTLRNGQLEGGKGQPGPRRPFGGGPLISDGGG